MKTKTALIMTAVMAAFLTGGYSGEDIRSQGELLKDITPSSLRVEPEVFEEKPLKLAQILEEEALEATYPGLEERDEDSWDVIFPEPGVGWEDEGESLTGESEKDVEDTEEGSPEEASWEASDEEESAPEAATEEEKPAPEEETGQEEEKAPSGEETKEEPKEESDAGAVGTPDAKQKKKALRKAKKLAAQYDYGAAIETLRGVENYKNDQDMVDAIRAYKAQRKACVEYPLEQITHVFFHSLVVDTDRAFDGDYNSAGYNQVMTTVSEFRKIIQILYDRGYVLVSPHDMAYKDENGVMQRGSILLPEGKTPFVMSQDDVSYYHYMRGDGLADKLVLDEKGRVKCQYTLASGETVVGDYDLVPILDSFVREHPDFSYHGRKGILAMTGYNGVLGYRTDKLQWQFLEENPDFDFDEEVRQAKEVADAMKRDGWEFASHTWGHRNATQSSADELIADDLRYKESVVPVLGETDMIIFAFGADIGNWAPYTYDNPKFAYYKGAGYDYYCNVDSSQYWVQLTGDFLRQGRRNLDGYRLWQDMTNKNRTSDLFNAEEIFDPARPTPVPDYNGG